MRKATDLTVVGNFADAKLEHFGVTTSFFRHGDKFTVRTGGPDGELHDYPIAYIFGVYPLQQYLIAFPGGGLQALGIAWTRPKDQVANTGFTFILVNSSKPANHCIGPAPIRVELPMCRCYSTNLQKNYGFAANKTMPSAGPISTLPTKAPCARWSDADAGIARAYWLDRAAKSPGNLLRTLSFS
jgi:hypothetical protein